MENPSVFAAPDPLDDEPNTRPPDSRFRAVAALLTQGLLRAPGGPAETPLSAPAEVRQIYDCPANPLGEQRFELAVRGAPHTGS